MRAKRLPGSFYTRTDVVLIAQELLGKCIVADLPDGRTVGKIVETEAYEGPWDQASHARNGVRTPRNEVMYAPGGTAYVYICYGIHHLFNVITHEKEIPHAVLIRAIEPVEGVEIMLKRRAMKKAAYSLSNGPGSLSQAMGIRISHNGENLVRGNRIWLEDRGYVPENIISGPRVGIGTAKDHVHLPYRFRIAGNPWAGRAEPKY